MSERIRMRPDRLPVMLLVASVLAAVPAAASWTYQDPGMGDPEALQPQLEQALADGDGERAVELAGQLAEIAQVRHIEALYNLAAVHARLGETEPAYEALAEAMEAGFWDFQHLLKDEDFAAIRDQERFRTLWRGAWSKQYIAMLEREERDEFQLPDRVMRTLALRPGERVADVGAGSGYFTVRLARAVAPGGTVLATDVRQEMLDYLENRLLEEKIENVSLKLVPRDDPQLPARGVDTIVLVDVWHYIRDPEFARKLAAGLAPGGRIVVIDYRPRPFEERPWGPPPRQQTPREEVDAHFAEAGLRPTEVHDFLPEQYFVVYRAE